MWVCESVTVAEMSDGDEVPDIELKQSDSVGSIEQLTLQVGNRVKIPDEFINYLGLEEGDDVGVLCRNGSIVVIEWSIEKISEMKDDLER